jgi:hypothetical protein
MRGLIMLISKGGLPPYLCPSGAFLDLGTQCLKSSGALAISLLIKAVPRPGFLEWFARSVYGKSAQLAPAPGYVAPPLDGVWATSPSYLHNGSVHRYRSCLIVRTDRNIGPARSIRRTIIQTAARLRRAVPPGRCAGLITLKTRKTGLRRVPGGHRPRRRATLLSAHYKDLPPLAIVPPPAESWPGGGFTSSLSSACKSAGASR